MKGKNTGYNKKEVSEKREGKKSVGKQTPLTEQKPQTTRIIEEIKKRILRSFDNWKLDKEAIKALKKLNQQNRANLTEEEKNQLDKELANFWLYTYERKRGFLKRVIDLLAKGADVNAKNNNGWTALHYAASHNYTRIAELLLKYGADPNAKNDRGWTALHIAADHDYFDLPELLIKYGADPNAKDNDGWTALHIAALENHPYVAKYLLIHGANPDIQDYEGQTALHIAAENDYPEIAELLIKHGADPTIKNKYRKTPLDIALENNNEEMVRIIEENSYL